MAAKPVQGVRHDAALQVAAQVDRRAVGLTEIKRGAHPLAGGHAVLPRAPVARPSAMLYLIAPTERPRMMLRWKMK